MNLIKLGGLLGLAYFGSKALAARGSPRAALQSVGEKARNVLGSAPAIGSNAGERLNSARLSTLAGAPGGSGDDLLQSSSQSGTGPRGTGLGDFARGA